jgi:hypothetical protein
VVFGLGDKITILSVVRLPNPHRSQTMASETERSLFRLAIAASTHSQQFGLSGYTLGPLSNEQIIEIGQDLIRLFEERYEDEIKKAPPGNPGALSSPQGGQRKRRRLRCQ